MALTNEHRLGGLPEMFSPLALDIRSPHSVPGQGGVGGPSYLFQGLAALGVPWPVATSFQSLPRLPPGRLCVCVLSPSH